MHVVDGVQQQAGATCSTTTGASSESEDSSSLAQGKVINVQPGFLANAANRVKTILGLSVQGGNRYGSTLVLSNKNHVEVTIITWVLFDKTSPQGRTTCMDFILFPP